jgi:hypothetical protein
VDSEGSVPYDQPQIKIKVLNERETTVYLDNYMEGHFLEIDALNDGVWEPRLSDRPSCTNECDRFTQGEACCMAETCEGPPFMLFVLNPGEDNWVDHYWHGDLFATDIDHCSDCKCYRELQVMTGTYRARVCAYNEFECAPSFSCDDALPTGPFANGTVAGSHVCYAVEFEVPYEEEYLYLIISPETIVVV